MAKPDSTKLISKLSEIVGTEHVLWDDANRACFATDLLYDGTAPLCIVSPKTAEALVSAIKTIYKAKCAIVPRGGGLSYSAGYVANLANVVIIDTRYLDHILEINIDDLYVTVEAGITWAKLNEALAECNVRTPFWGTGSGKFATVGGTLSQNAVNYGSGQFGLSAQSVLGLDIVTANGSVLTTGSGGNDTNPSPFLRHYGPDLTGLFTGDCGALGIKSKATLQLIRRPSVTRYAAYEYTSVDAFSRALSEVARCHVTSECFGFDPGFTAMRTTYAGLKDGLEIMSGVAKAQNSMISGIKEALSVAKAGQRYLNNIGYSIHITVDGRDSIDANSRLDTARKALEENGKEIPTSVPKVMRGTPFPDPTIAIGHNGERWIPMHGIVPHSRFSAALTNLKMFFQNNSSLLKQHRIAWCFTAVPVGPSGILLEPNLYWRDSRPIMLDGYLPEAYLNDKPTYPKDIAARDAVKQLRNGLIALFRTHGGVHLQIGRVYPYLESRSPDVRALLTALKTHLDPQGLMNPGSIGL